MNTTCTSEPTVEAIATNLKVARLNHLMNRLENLAKIEQYLKNLDCPFGEKMIELRENEAKMTETRQEIIDLATR